MINDVPLHRRLYNRVGANANNWKLGGASNDGELEFYGETTFNIDGETNTVKSYSVEIFTKAFITNLELANTIGHELHHIQHATKGLINFWLGGNPDNLDYAKWASEIKAYKDWNLNYSNPLEAKQMMFYYSEKIYDNYPNIK